MHLSSVEINYVRQVPESFKYPHLKFLQIFPSFLVLRGPYSMYFVCFGGGVGGGGYSGGVFLPIVVINF